MNTGYTTPLRPGTIPSENWGTYSSPTAGQSKHYTYTGKKITGYSDVYKNRVNSLNEEDLNSFIPYYNEAMKKNMSNPEYQKSVDYFNDPNITTSEKLQFLKEKAIDGWYGPLHQFISDRIDTPNPTIDGSSPNPTKQDVLPAIDDEETPEYGDVFTPLVKTDKEDDKYKGGEVVVDTPRKKFNFNPKGLFIGSQLANSVSANNRIAQTQLQHLKPVVLQNPAEIHKSIYTNLANQQVARNSGEQYMNQANRAARSTSDGNRQTAIQLQGSLNYRNITDKAKVDNTNMYNQTKDASIANMQRYSDMRTDIANKNAVGYGQYRENVGNILANRTKNNAEALNLALKDTHDYLSNWNGRRRTNQIQDAKAGADLDYQIAEKAATEKYTAAYAAAGSDPELQAKAYAAYKREIETAQLNRLQEYRKAGSIDHALDFTTNWRTGGTDINFQGSTPNKKFGGKIQYIQNGASVRLMNAQYVPLGDDSFDLDAHQAANRGSSGSSGSKKKDSSNELELIKEGTLNKIMSEILPADSKIFFDKLKDYQRQLQIAPSANLAYQAQMELSEIANRLLFDASEHKEAKAHVKETGSGNDIAITDNGAVYAITEQGFKMMSPLELKQGMKVLTNNELLNYRSRSDSFGGDPDSILAVKGSIGLKDITDNILKLSKDLGSDSSTLSRLVDSGVFDGATQEKLTDFQNQILHQGLHDLLLVENGRVILNTNIDNAESKLQHYVTLVRNMLSKKAQMVIIGNAKLQGDENSPETIINNYITSSFRGPRKDKESNTFKIDGSKDSDKSGSGSSTGLAEVSQIYANIYHGTREGVMIGGQAGIKTQGVSLGNTFMKQDGTSGESGDLLLRDALGQDVISTTTTGKMYVGGVEIDPNLAKTELVVQPSSGIYAINLPVTKNGDLDLEVLTILDELDKQSQHDNTEFNRLLKLEMNNGRLLNKVRLDATTGAIKFTNSGRFLQMDATFSKHLADTDNPLISEASSEETDRYEAFVKENKGNDKVGWFYGSRARKGKLFMKIDDAKVNLSNGTYVKKDSPWNVGAKAQGKKIEQSTTILNSK